MAVHAGHSQGGGIETTDPSLYHAAMRELLEETGIHSGMFRDRVRAGPDVVAMPNTSYFAFALSEPLSQEELKACFSRRKELGTIKRIAWRGLQDIRDDVWRREDKAVIQRLTAEDRYANVKNAAFEERGGGC